jgi:hypothetical protein
LLDVIRQDSRGGLNDLAFARLENKSCSRTGAEVRRGEEAVEGEEERLPG